MTTERRIPRLTDDRNMVSTLVVVCELSPADAAGSPPYAIPCGCAGEFRCPDEILAHRKKNHATWSSGPDSRASERRESGVLDTFEKKLTIRGGPTARGGFRPRRSDLNLDADERLVLGSLRSRSCVPLRLRAEMAVAPCVLPAPRRRIRSCLGGGDRVCARWLRSRWPLERCSSVQRAQSPRWARRGR